MNGAVSLAPMKKAPMSFGVNPWAWAACSAHVRSVSLALPIWSARGIVRRLAHGRHDLFVTRCASSINGLTCLAARLAG